MKMRSRVGPDEKEARVDIRKLRNGFAHCAVWYVSNAKDDSNDKTGNTTAVGMSMTQNFSRCRTEVSRTWREGDGWSPEAVNRTSVKEPTRSLIDRRRWALLREFGVFQVCTSRHLLGSRGGGQGRVGWTLKGECSLDGVPGREDRRTIPHCRYSYHTLEEGV